MERADLVVVGAGAAGLMAAIQAGRARPGTDILLLDGAATLGRKILISGGGRCNVTHDVVVPEDFCGATRPAIRKVLRHLDVAQTKAFFEEIGVPLVREETGKLFPRANRARAVLEALLGATEQAGCRIRHPWRVSRILRDASGFEIHSDDEIIGSDRVILATGGRSVPTTGSDGHGYAMAEALGHTMTPLVLQALVPLLLAQGHPLTTIRGVSQDVRLSLHDGQGRIVRRVEGSMLLTHFGISGPAVLDMSRHWLVLRESDPEAGVRVSWLPEDDEASLDGWLRSAPQARLLPHLATRLPKRLAAVLCEMAEVDGETRGAHLPREARRRILRMVANQPLPITGPRGWSYAEVTAGGIPLTEVQLERMESRSCPGLYLCGEILDVDGRIGGFNFQWAWASGLLAGRGAAMAS